MNRPTKLLECPYNRARLTSLQIDVSPDGSMVRRGVDWLLHLVIVREQRPTLASPHPLSPDATGRNALEQRRREENVVNLVALVAIAEGSRTPVALELRMDRNVLEVRSSENNGCSGAVSGVSLKSPTTA